MEPYGGFDVLWAMASKPPAQTSAARRVHSPRGRGGWLWMAAFPLLCAPSQTTEAAVPCLIQGRPERLLVLVRPEGDKPFVVMLRDLAVQALPPNRGTTTGVRVETPLRLVGTTEDAEYMVRQPIDVVSGLLRLSPEAALSKIVARGDSVLATAQLAPRFSNSALVHQVQLPCVAIELGPKPNPPTPPGGYAPDGASYAARPIPPVITLRRGPGAGAALTIHIQELKSFRLAEFATEGRWSHVRQQLKDGSGLDGWLPTRELSWGSLSYVFGGAPVHIDPGCATRRRDDLTASASIAVGTSVYAQPGHGPWATLMADSGLRVRNTPKGDWLQVTQIPGITDESMCTSLSHAWVRRTAVHVLSPSTTHDR